jgi:hypothetical protein
MATAQGNGAPPVKAKPKPLLAALVLIVALGLFAAAFVYAGGMDYVTQLLAGGAATPTTPVPPKPPTSTKPADVPDALAKRMYIEQIESASSIERLAAGMTTGFTIDKVEDKSATEKWVAITANFTDAPTTMKGVMAFSKAGANWYFLWIQDLTGVAENADALLSTPLLTEPKEPTAEEYEEFGIKTVDQSVIDTVLTSQAANQALVQGILDGTYTTITCEKPVAGPGTITIPVTATATGAKGDTRGSVTLLIKMIDGKDRTFIASFKKQ